MTDSSARKTVDVAPCKCEVEKTTLKTRLLSYFFIIIILLLVYYATFNIEWYYIIRVTNLAESDLYQAIFAAIIFASYVVFIYEYIRPAKFSLKVALVAIVVMSVVAIGTYFLISS